jgi:hypothetical protein
VREDLGFADADVACAGGPAGWGRSHDQLADHAEHRTDGHDDARAAPVEDVPDADPARAETTRPRENAPVVAPAGQPVAVMI